MLRIGLGQLDQGLAGLLTKVFQLGAERVGYGLAARRQIIFLLWITALVVELNLGRSDVQILPRTQCAQRTPTESPMRIIGFGVRWTIFCRGALCARCFHQRQQRLPLHLGWNRDGCLPKHGGSDVHQADSSLYLLTRRMKPGQLDDQWHVDGGVIEKNTVRVLPVFTQ